MLNFELLIVKLILRSFLFIDTMSQQMICIEDFQKYADQHLTPSVRDYYNSGAGEQFSLKLNTEAFKKYVKKKKKEIIIVIKI